MELTEDIDIPAIDKIYWQHHADDFYVPSLSHTITSASAMDRGKLIAFGMVKLFPEAILIMDKDASLRQRSTAWRLLMNKAIKDTRAGAHQYLHATIHDDAYLSLLSKHYGFTLSDGKQVSLEL